MSKDPRVPMAAMSLSDLQREVGACVALMGFDLKDAVVVHTTSGEDQLWVRPDYDKYRSAWESAFGSVPNEYHVDHLYAKQRALQYKYAYVRLVLTMGSVNTSYGGGVEKQMNKVPVSPNPNPPVRYADWYQIQKLSGVILGGRRRGYLPTDKKLGKSITGGGKLRYTPAHVARKGSTHIVTLGTKDYSAVGDLLGWLMEVLVGLSNESLVSDALKRLEPSIWDAMPEAGGVLVALVFQQPNNAASYGFSTALFMYAYVVASGADASEAHERRMQEEARPGHATISQSPSPNWHKVVHYMWVSSHSTGAAR